MTQLQLNEIKARLETALPKADGMRDRLAMEWSTADRRRRTNAKIWYDDGNECAEVHDNLGLDIDGDAIANLFAHAMQDISALLAEIERLNKLLP